jgi:hypothetical protein
MVEILQYIIGFAIFMIMQAFFINGVFELCRGKCVNDIKDGKKCSGNLFYMINPEFFERGKGKEWGNPLFSCVRCMASVWSLITFFPTVIYLFGFHLVEIPVWVFDAIGLVSLNYLVYKKL